LPARGRAAPRPPGLAVAAGHAELPRGAQLPGLGRLAASACPAGGLRLPDAAAGTRPGAVMSPPGTMAARPPAVPTPRARWHSWWMRVRTPVTWAFFALVAWLIWRQARELDWPLVWRTLRGLSAGTLALAAALAGASHAV